jgi:purine-binding chemotaxis protein CheW
MESNELSLQYLTFRLGEEVFAIEVIRTREVLDCSIITRVPQTPEFVLGVINLRGSVVPVIDLRLKFGLPPVEKTVHSCIIVMQIEVDDESVTIGALVDSVQEVLELREDEIELPPRIGTRLKTEYIRGMGNCGDRFLILLDIDRVFSADELVLVQKADEELIMATTGAI